MTVCEVCGNDYDKSFQVIRAGSRHTFDSFECAIFALAPTCLHCGCRVIGHGVEADGVIYCCAHCARQKGEGAFQFRGMAWSCAQKLSKRWLMMAARTGSKCSAPERFQRMPGPVRRARNCLQPLSAKPLPMG
jgi:hypothetical protein